MGERCREGLRASQYKGRIGHWRRLGHRSRGGGMRKRASIAPLASALCSKKATGTWSACGDDWGGSGGFRGRWRVNSRDGGHDEDEFAGPFSYCQRSAPTPLITKKMRERPSLSRTRSISMAPPPAASSPTWFRGSHVVRKARSLQKSALSPPAPPPAPHQSCPPPPPLALSLRGEWWPVAATRRCPPRPLPPPPPRSTTCPSRAPPSPPPFPPSLLGW